MIKVITAWKPAFQNHDGKLFCINLWHAKHTFSWFHAASTFMPGSLILWSLKCFWANTSCCAVFYLVASSSLLSLYIKTAKTNETAQMRSSSFLYGIRAIFACWKSYHHVAKGWHFINIFTVLNLSPSDQTFFEKIIIICYVQLLPPARQRNPWQKKQCIKLWKWRHIMRLTVCRQLKQHTLYFAICLWSIFVMNNTLVYGKKEGFILVQNDFQPSFDYYFMTGNFHTSDQCQWPISQWRLPALSLRHFDVSFWRHHLPNISTLLLIGAKPKISSLQILARQANLCLRAFRHDKF